MKLVLVILNLAGMSFWTVFAMGFFSPVNPYEVIFYPVVFCTALLFFIHAAVISIFERCPVELGAVSLLFGMAWIVIFVNGVGQTIKGVGLVTAPWVFIMIGTICILVMTGVNSIFDRLKS